VRKERADKKTRLWTQSLVDGLDSKRDGRSSYEKGEGGGRGITEKRARRANPKLQSDIGAEKAGLGGGSKLNDGGENLYRVR